MQQKPQGEYQDYPGEGRSQEQCLIYYNTILYRMPFSQALW